MEWISVKDQLPKDGYYNVLCNSDGGGNNPFVHSLWYIEGNWCFDYETSPNEPLFTSSFYIEVTHWMPLPEPPKQ